MTIFVDNNSRFKDELLNEIGLVKIYLDDLYNLSAGRYPDWSDLARAPTVRSWRRGLVPSDAIVGIFSGFDDVGQMVSRPLQILSTKGGWARTEGGLVKLVGAKWT